MEAVAKAVGEKEVWKRIEKIKYREGQSGVGLRHIYGQKKNAARRVVDKARNDVENEVYNKLEAHGGRKMIYKLARDRDEDGKDMKGWGVVIKDGGERLDASDRGQYYYKGVGRVFQGAVELRKHRQAGATALCRSKSVVGGDHGGDADSIEEDEEGRSTRR